MALVTSRRKNWAYSLFEEIELSDRNSRFASDILCPSLAAGHCKAAKSQTEQQERGMLAKRHGSPIEIFSHFSLMVTQTSLL
jgi:hypothetical protein